MTSKKSRIFKKTGPQVLFTINPVNTCNDTITQPRQVIHWSVDQRGIINIIPKRFHGIQFRGIGRKPFHFEPRTKSFNCLLHPLAPMCRQTIPNKNYRPMTMPLECSQESHNLASMDSPFVNSQEPATRFSGRVSKNSTDTGQSLPVERFLDQRGLTTRRPGGPNGRTLRESSLVEETQPGIQFCSVFFTLGQRLLTHWAIANSSRSLARRDGRWRLQPSACRTRQTWQGW